MQKSIGEDKKMRYGTMNKAQKDFMMLLKNALLQKNNLINDIDYEAVEQIALNHLCLPLVCDAALKCGKNVPEKWKQHCAYVVVNNYKNLTVQDKVLKLLNSSNIKCAVLKGITVSRYYPEPTHRPLGDIDILVEADKYDAAIDLLTGSSERDSEKLKHKFHYGIVFESVSVEIHKYITEYTKDEHGALLEKYFDNALETVISGEYDNFVFPMLNNKWQVLAIVSHIQRHFNVRGTTMRMLCDLGMLVKNITDEQWQNEIYPALKEVGLDRFTDALLSVCDKHLGMDFKGKINQLIDENITDGLMAEILCDGIKPEYTDINKLSCFEKFKNIFITIYEIVNRDFKITKKYSILTPLFFVYVPLRSRFRKAIGQRKNISVLGYGTSYSRRNSIRKELDIFE